ncbi:MAG: hypothetical protein U9Q05_02285 [Thermodesulfobacteriota bacterium]|nr:hypothetical protein [Thermodesulfobacteriota bacterium]
MGTKREIEWYRKFQEGTFLIRGWQSRKKEILGAIPATEKDTVDELLDKLGEKIGKEWARARHVRRIDTTTLQQWGEHLRKSRKKGSDILVAEIRELDTTVDKIIA